MTPIVITVPWDAGTLAPNQRMHHMKKYRLTVGARRTAGLAWIAAGRPRATKRVQVDIIIRRARELDADNAVASLKALMDGLFNSSVTPNDSPRWVRLGRVTQEIDAKWKHAETVTFTIREDSE